MCRWCVASACGGAEGMERASVRAHPVCSPFHVDGFTHKRSLQMDIRFDGALVCSKVESLQTLTAVRSCGHSVRAAQACIHYEG